MSDIAFTEEEINSQIDGIKIYNETSKNEKILKKNKGNTFSESFDKFSTGLNKITEQQKRYQKNTPNSYDKLLGLIGQTSSNGPETLKYLRKKLFEVLTKLEPDVQKIISENALKALGCSHEQTYPTYNLTPQQLQSLSLLNSNVGLYVPVSDIDFIGNLKLDPTQKIGKQYYESFEPQISNDFINYGPGTRKFPVNKMLHLRMTSTNVSRNFSTEFSTFYNGESKNKLFDIQYTNVDNLGVSGDYFRIFLIDRTNTSTSTVGNLSYSGANQVKKFVQDYYKTIKMVDLNSVMASLLNYATGYLSIKGEFGYEKLDKDSKFSLMIQRILGLCFDSREEIDISGVAKIPELDGVDDTFFEFTESDLKIIQQEINNIQMGVVEYEDCGNVKLPVNPDPIINDITEFANTLTGSTPDNIVKHMEKIVDNVSNNTEWAVKVPSQASLDISLNKNILKNLPKAVAYSLLSPKVLLPIFTLLKVTESSGYNTANQFIGSGNTAIQSANTTLQSGNTIGQTVYNSVSDGVDFIKKFKSFVIATISAINEKFLSVLYDILKKDILNLLKTIIGDVTNSRNKKTMAIILRLTEFALILIEGRKDFKRCKSLFDSILKLLKLVNDISGTKNRIPSALLNFVQFLPGATPEGATKNALQLIQSIGLPTGDLPGGVPNLMNQLILQINKGLDKERSENEKIQVTLDPLVPGQFWGKAQ